MTLKHNYFYMLLLRPILPGGFSIYGVRLLTMFTSCAGSSEHLSFFWTAHLMISVREKQTHSATGADFGPTSQMSSPSQRKRATWDLLLEPSSGS